MRYKLVPVVPTEEQWGGLARDIIMWMDCYEGGGNKTPRNLFKHLEALGRKVPQWLRDESEMKNLDSVPSKGTRAAIIYRAMLEVAPQVEGQEPVAWTQNDGEHISLTEDEWHCIPLYTHPAPPHQEGFSPCDMATAAAQGFRDGVESVREAKPLGDAELLAAFGSAETIIDGLHEVAKLAAQPAHPDDIAIDKFAAAMKAKMAKQRAKGYSGWDDSAQCPTERLQTMLNEHIGKGDPVDVGNFSMMLHARGENTAKPVQVPEHPAQPDLLNALLEQQLGRPAYDWALALDIIANCKELLREASQAQPVREPIDGMQEFVADLERSRAKHPGIKRMFDGLLGEVHELKRAYHGDGDVRAEAFDVAVRAYRIATEGDDGNNTKTHHVPDWMAWSEAAPAQPAQGPVAWPSNEQHIAEFIGSNYSTKTDGAYTLTPHDLLSSFADWALDRQDSPPSWCPLPIHHPSPLAQEPTCEGFGPGDMADAAAQGFRDGEAAALAALKPPTAEQQDKLRVLLTVAKQAPITGVVVVPGHLFIALHKAANGIKGAA
jgi:hypothetical protein